MEQRIDLGELPTWAQDLIVSTATGLLNDSDAYAEPVEWENHFRIKAHGFTYTVKKGAERVF